MSKDQKVTSGDEKKKVNEIKIQANEENGFGLLIPVACIPKDLGLFSLSGFDCRFSVGVSHKTLFMDTEIKEGVYRWDIEISYDKNKNKFASVLYVGIAVKSVLHSLINNPIGRVAESGAFHFGYKNDNASAAAPLYSAFYYAATYSEITDEKTIVPQGAKVGVELNMDAHTLYFFVNGMKIPHVFVNIPPIVYLGVTGFNGSSFKTVALRQLAQPSVPSTSSSSSAPDKEYLWK